MTRLFKLNFVYLVSFVDYCFYTLFNIGLLLSFKELLKNEVSWIITKIGQIELFDFIFSILLLNLYKFSWFTFEFVVWIKHFLTIIHFIIRWTIKTLIIKYLFLLIFFDFVKNYPSIWFTIDILISIFSFVYGFIQLELHLFYIGKSPDRKSVV